MCGSGQGLVLLSLTQNPNLLDQTIWINEDTILKYRYKC